MATQMTIVSEELIKPSSPTPQTLKSSKLSYLDQVIETCYMPIILFYPPNHELLDLNSNIIDDRTPKKYHQLKQSLSKVLTKFYPFAGRINYINSSVDCNDSGVLFIEARVQSQLSDAIQNIPVGELSQYLPCEPYQVTKDHIPLAVKISFFDCGGMAIGICLSHKITDALSLGTFLKSWAATSRGEIDIEIPDFHLGPHHFPAMDNIPEVEPPPVPEEKIVMKRFVFDKEKIQALKGQASSALKNPSRVQVVTAFIWKHFIDVTRAKSNTKTKFVAAQAVSLRPRMNPPFPESAMGNLVKMAYAITEDNKDFSNLVAQLINSIRKIDDQLQKGLTNLDYEGSSSEEEEEMYFFSSWCRMGFYELDFGWGKPISACNTTMPLKNSVYLMDTRCGDGVEAWISMFEDEMAMLPPDFLSLVDTDFSN